MIQPARHPHTARLLLLAAVLVIVQVLGLMHGVLHPHTGAGGQVRAAAQTLGEHADGSLSGVLFAEHASQADCDRFDHITHADPARFDAPHFVLQRADQVEVAVHAGWHIAPRSARFFARGPPSQA